MKKDDIYFVFQELTKRYAGSTTELVYETPFQLLVSVIMSAQTTDKQVNKVTATFYDRVKRPEDILAIAPEQWEEMIKGVNYYRNKAKNIYKLAGILASNAEFATTPEHRRFVQMRGYRIPDTQDALVELPGVGEKTAKVILQVLHGHDVIAVDTHVHRVVNRLGIVDTKEPLHTSKILEAKVPDAFRMDAHHGLILFGRYHCLARNPKCESCPFTKICKWYKRNKVGKGLKK